MYSGQGQSVPQSGHGKEDWLAIGFMMPPVWRLVQTTEVLDDKSAGGRAMRCQDFFVRFTLAHRASTAFRAAARRCSGVDAAASADWATSAYGGGPKTRHPPGEVT